jgi:hypothetical protein
MTNSMFERVYSYIEHPITLSRGVLLTVSSQVSVDRNVEVIEFQRLKDLSDNGAVEALAKDFGIVYVTAITRDGCSGCMEQKPLFRELAQKMNSDLGTNVHFANVHVRYAEDDRKDSWDSKRIFRHAAYPTYLVHVRSRNGVLEVYRAIYPSMEELEKQVRESLDLAKFYKDAA